jgi:catechol 2,3-dioxygenase-like lactoylglutathione lyase family enzyme
VNVRDDAEFHGEALVGTAGDLAARLALVKAEFAIPWSAPLLPWQEVSMAIVLNHTIVPAHDKVASAEFFARIFGLDYRGPHSHFAPVQVNDGLTLDFDNRDRFESHHYAFKVSETEFDEIFGRVKKAGISYGSGPRSRTDGEINHRNGGRGVYFDDPNGHVLEILTV